MGSNQIIYYYMKGRQGNQLVTSPLAPLIYDKLDYNEQNAGGKANQVFTENDMPDLHPPMISESSKINNQQNRGIDRGKLIQLVVGIVGIVVTFSLASIFFELLVKHKYINRKTGKEELCDNFYGYNFCHSLFVWGFGKLYIVFYLRKRDKGRVAQAVSFKYAGLCSVFMLFGNIMSMYAVHFTSYPVIIVFKACSVLSVILVGVFCTRVQDKKLKIGKQKIIAAFMITLCVFFFQFFDPATRDRQLTAQFLGILCLIASILSDGFYPDFQAKIKSENKDLDPLAMMTKIHLFIFIMSFGILLVTWSGISYVVFIDEHPEYLVNLLGQIICSFVGQIFVYRMIKQFKQHVVPFTVTTRKIMSVFWSILFFGHATNWIQIVSVLCLLAVVCFQFKIEVSKSKNSILSDSEPKQNQLTKQLNENDQTQSNEGNQTKMRLERNNMEWKGSMISSSDVQQSIQDTVNSEQNKGQKHFSSKQSNVKQNKSQAKDDI